MRLPAISARAPSAGRLSLRALLSLTGFCLLVTGFAHAADRAVLMEAARSIQSSELQRHVDVLADDTFEGREAGSRGGRAAAGYLVDQFEKLGLAGGGEDGGYFQPFQGRYRNLLVRLEGSDPERKREVIVVGAHYDHVGYGTLTNSYGPTGYIHNGADDNASGTAALLEMLEALAQLPDRPARTLLFAFWDGEEKGLLGSKHWAAEPTVSLDQVTAAVNVDMVGRLGDRRLRVFGTRTSPGFRQLVSRQNADSPLQLDFVWDVESNSDHYSFFERRIPFLMLHTGLHRDYHRPSDDADKLDAEGLQHVSRLLFHVVYELADRQEAIPFRAASLRESDYDRRRLETPSPAPPPRLGLSWKAETSESGELAVTRVSPESPADRAGLRVGDVLTALNGRAIENGLDFQSQVLAAGDRIRLSVLRGAQASADEPMERQVEEIEVELAGEPQRLGISWREDPAEPGSVVVSRVVQGSAAHRGGLRVRDRILQFGGQRFAVSNSRLRELVGTSSGAVRVLVERRGQLKNLTVELPVSAPAQ